MQGRRVRRLAGLLQARLPELGLDEVPDPRGRAGRWSLAQILRATLLGLMTGCRSLAESETLTATLAPAMRRRLGLPRRLADTTARDALCRVSLDGLRAALHRMAHAAWRRKALTPLLVRRHWGVENQCHHTLDTAFEEDDRPWIEADPRGMLAVLLLRRIALTLLALYRAVTLRSTRSKKRRSATPWKALLQALRDTLVAATEQHLAGLRLRGISAATR